MEMNRVDPPSGAQPDSRTTTTSDSIPDLSIRAF
jgi:hypothetical protein